LTVDVTTLRAPRRVKTCVMGYGEECLAIFLTFSIRVAYGGAGLTRPLPNVS
jgi:hypothetical protein